MEERRLHKLNIPEASAMKAEEAFSALGSASSGLTRDQVAARQTTFGPHELRTKKVGAGTVLRRQFVSPMVWLLFGAAGVSGALGKWTDAATVVAILAINVGIGFYQEYRSERALEKLAQHLSPRARVRRAGEAVTVERGELVPGDVVLLQSGDIVPADLRLTLANAFTVDESFLTGESVAVSKTSEAVPAKEASEARGMAFMQSVVTGGFAEGVVTATGSATAVGELARLVEETPRVSSFQKNIEALSGFLLKAVAVVLAAVFLGNVLIKGETQVVPQLLFAVALAVSVIPEALPAVATVTLSGGAMRLAKRHVVVKRLSAIEDLGHIEVLCTDKTGTITQSILSVERIEAADPRECHLFALMAAEEELGSLDKPKTFDAALAAKADAELRFEAAKSARKWFAPFNPERRRTSAVIERGSARWLVTLGAPEEVLRRCDRVASKGGSRSFRAEERAAIEKRIREEGLKGRRVLAVARKEIGEGPDYGEDDEWHAECLGWISFHDPLKPTARKAVHDAAALGVRVKIITGDAVEVAGAIGVETGVIGRPEEVITGAELDALDETGLHEAVERRHVFARVSPAQKFRIIQALERTRQVGFLGEGINDAPALKLANVALVVDGASDVAREAADIILLRKDLRVIVDGIRTGRAIFTNIVKYVKYTLIGNFGNFVAIAGISLLVDYLPMLPVQILLTNILTDLPLMAVSGDAVDEQDLETPRRFNIRELAFIGLFLGMVSSVFDFAYFAMHRMLPASGVQTYWYLFSVLTELALIYSIRTRGFFLRASRPGRWLNFFAIVTVAVAVALPFTGFGQEVFGFIRPTTGRMLGLLGLAAAYFIATETVKLSYAKLFPVRPEPSR